MKRENQQFRRFGNTLKISIIGSFFFVVISCSDKVLNSSSTTVVNSQSDTLTMDKTPQDFANQLINREFGEFFIYPMHDRTIDNIWRDPSNHALMDSIMNAPNISMEAKFLVCEIGFKKDHMFITRYFQKDIVEIYAAALVNNYTGMANPWGMLYKHNDAGTVGAVFLILGKSAIPTLTDLLEDDRILLSYNGSVEATVGNSYKFRIKDFAAYYLGEILDFPLEYFADNKERDQQIEELKLAIQKADD